MAPESRSPFSMAPGPWIFGERQDPAPLARPHLVPTRDWGVVVDTASVPETNLADSLVKHSTEASLSTDPEANRERLATCRQPAENREGPTFLSVSIGRRESRPSSSRRWGAFSPICRIRQGRLVSPLLSSCSPCGPRPDERLARCAVTTAWFGAPVILTTLRHPPLL